MNEKNYDITENSRLLSDVLADEGVRLDLRCGGHGACGRCRVTLVTGRWTVAGRLVEAPAEANACQTMLASESGRISIPESSLLQNATAGTALETWNGCAPMPACPQVTIGFDIGTTTLAAAAFQNGRCLGTASCYNPQAAFGDNVMARISAAKTHFGEMRECLLVAMRGLMGELALEMPPARVAVAGNATMTCIFHGIDPTPLGAHPFALPQWFFPAVSASCIGLPDDVLIVTISPASAFIGGDIVAGLGEVALQPGEAFMDLGTNCEMVIRLPDGTYCGTAAAAGPAFEGAGISCGCRAIPGALKSYVSSTDFGVIGDGDATVGVCGSGLVDVLAAWKRSGRLSPFGRFQPPAESVEVVHGIALTEEDVSKLVVAKAAVAAGFQTLAKHCGVSVSRLVLAGGFAQYLNLENARAIGLLPDVPTITVGNTSLAGAVRLSCTPELSKKQEEPKMEEFLLNDDPAFENAFIDAMRL